MVNVIDGQADTSSLLSSYADAVESYKLVSLPGYSRVKDSWSRLGRSDWRERGVIRPEAEIPI
jgi:hypothetical protein